MQRTIKSKKQHRRHGAAVTELAVCLPMLLLLVIGTIEASTMIYLKQSLTVAAYEGARQALVPSSDVDEITEVVNAVLEPRRTAQSRITVTPQNYVDSPPGTWIEVTVSAPCNANSVFPGWFYNGQTLNGKAVMMKEF